MRENNILPGVILVIAGILMYIPRITKWEWFINHYKVRYIEDSLGKKGADTFYFILSLIFIIVGVLISFGVIY